MGPPDALLTSNNKTPLIASKTWRKYVSIPAPPLSALAFSFPGSLLSTASAKNVTEDSTLLLKLKLNPVFYLPFLGVAIIQTRLYYYLPNNRQVNHLARVLAYEI